MEQSKPKVIISMPCHNRREYTELVAPQVIRVKRQYENAILYVGDDNSTDGTYEYLETLTDIDYLERDKVGNSVWQFNRAVKIGREQGCKYIYAMANDILMPEDIVSEMVDIMEGHSNLMSVMVEECGGMPFIKDDYMLDLSYSFTSSLGIHRIDCFEDDIVAGNRFFGFQPYQARVMKEKNMEVGRVFGIGNTNLDMSVWSRQMQYFEKGYARTGLVPDKNSVYK